MKTKNKTKSPLPQLLSRKPSPSFLDLHFDEILRYPLVKGRSQHFNLRIPEPLYILAEKEAAIRNVSVSDFVRSCLILFTVPGALINTAKIRPGVKLNPQELIMLKQYKESLQGLLDDLKLVEHQLGDEETKLPRPKVLDMDWVEKVIEMKVNKIVQDRKAMEKQRQKGKKPK